MVFADCDSGPWLCRPFRPTRTAGRARLPDSWPGSGNKRPVGGSSGSCTPGTSESRASAARSRRPGAPVSPTSRGSCKSSNVHLFTLLLTSYNLTDTSFLHQYLISPEMHLKYLCYYSTNLFSDHVQYLVENDKDDSFLHRLLSMSAYHRQRVKEEKAAGLEQRRNRLRALLREERDRLEAELRDVTPDSGTLSRQLTQRAEELRTARDERRKKVVAWNLLRCQRSACINPVISPLSYPACTRASERALEEKHPRVARGSQVKML